MPASKDVVLRVYGDDPLAHRFADAEGTHAFSADRNPNTVVKISRDSAFTQKHLSIIGPDNSFLYLGPNNSGVGYALYGGNTTQFLMAHFRQPGKKEGSISKYWRALNGKDYKWKVYSEHKMECKDGNSLLATWEITPPAEEHFAVVTLKPSALPLITEVVTSLAVNRIAQAYSW
ncbi:hypothetical protein BKA70DRAFT_1370058 [Coprinopsis sp. MPI-PUGE-AT-0042]|nr:hypothetical protein BKA70DRAFT_1370058 [Coprinopsis sp. MPI-PUGE-AT-0042]